ncbi:hypothetical protein HMPREF5505_1918, partial [Lactobacillus delbrueckii subsp. lactis DSM 20072]
FGPADLIFFKKSACWQLGSERLNQGGLGEIDRGQPGQAGQVAGLRKQRRLAGLGPGLDRQGKFEIACKKARSSKCF